MAHENSILLVVNPIAGGSDKDNIVELISREILVQNFHPEVFKTTGENDKEAIGAAIKRIAPKRVLVVGGDGTVSIVANCLYGLDIPLGIIPAGSANGMSVNLGLPDALSEQIAIALSENTLRIDVVLIDGKPCLHIADLGINAELIKNYENSGIRGKIGYLLQSIPTILNSEAPFEFIVETEDGVFTESGILLAIANANKFGTGANINPNGKINDGKFEILVFKKLDFIEIIKTAQENPQMSPDFVSMLSTNKAIIRNKSLVHFQIDGEFMGETQSITVTIKPESLVLAVPEAFSTLHKKEQFA